MSSQSGGANNQPAVVDFSNFDKALAKYWVVMKKDLRWCVLQQARLVTDKIMDYTPPFNSGGGGGLAAGSRKWGDNAVDRDVREVFEPLGKLPPAWVGKNNDAALFRRWAGQHKSTSPKLMTMLQNPTNKVYRQFQTMVAGWGTPKYAVTIVDSPNTSLHNARRPTGGYANRHPQNRVFINKISSIKAFANMKKKSVGKLKSGWAYGANLLPSPPGTPRSKAPAYVKRHSGLGASSEQDQPFNYQIKLTNFIADNAGITSQKRAVQRAIDEQARNMELVVKRIIDRHMQAATRVNP